LNALETQVLELIGEDTTSPDVFLDTDAGMAPVRDSLNDAIQEITMITGAHKRRYFLPLRESQGFYRLRPQNGDLGWITDVWSTGKKYRLEQTDLLRVTRHDPRWMIHSGSPEAYFPIGKEVIGLYPKPAGDNNTLRITVVEIPEAYKSDTDRIKLKDSFKFAAVHYAVAEYWASRGDAREAEKHGLLYLQALGLRKDFRQDTGNPAQLQTGREPWPTVTA